MSATTDKIIANAEIAAKSLSSYVVVIASALAAYWMGLTGPEREAWIAAHPALLPVAPYLTFIVWAIARVLPQYITTHAQREQERLQGFIAAIVAAQAAGKLPPAAQLLPVPAGIDPKAVVEALRGSGQPPAAPSPPMPATAIVSAP